VVDAPVNILIVDDNRANLLALEAVLEPLGQRIVQASSGAEAVEKLEKEDFALVLMDVAMPMLNGFQTVEIIRLRERLRHLPIMFVTAIFRDEESARRGYKLGAVDFITKPLDPEIVRYKVSAFVILHQRNETVRRQQQQLAEETAARHAAEAAARAREELIAILAHDLRTPVATILVVGQRLKDDPALPARWHDTGVRLTRTALRMDHLIRNLVEHARLRLGGGIIVRPTAGDMDELCRSVVGELATVYPKRRIVIETQGDVRGAWDLDRVAQVVANLLENAIKHGGRDGAPVLVSLRPRSDEVTMSVHNSGDPIASDVLPTIFEPFQKGTQTPRGLGLGLYIAEQIVEAHGGTIGVQSTEADGTTFTVRWPRYARPTKEVAPLDQEAGGRGPLTGPCAASGSVQSACGKARHSMRVTSQPKYASACGPTVSRRTADDAVLARNAQTTWPESAGTLCEGTGVVLSTLNPTVAEYVTEQSMT
jgi:signal transduction histidine kinase